MFILKSLKLVSKYESVPQVFGSLELSQLVVKEKQVILIVFFGEFVILLQFFWVYVEVELSVILFVMQESEPMQVYTIV